jgi:hypothetical protein
MTEPERLASALMADLHNNNLMRTVNLEAAAHTIKNAFIAAISAERSECAKIADAHAAQWDASYREEGPRASDMASQIAAAIRARGTQ